MPHKKPYSEGWENLSVEERIIHWLEANKLKIGDEERAEDFRNFLLNFDASYHKLNSESLEQLAYELREAEFEFWTPEEKRLLWEGVFAMYNTTPGLLGLKLANDAREGYKFN
jgi:hypothetical protein